MSVQNQSTDSLNFRFDNRFVNDLPADPEPKNYRRQVNNACYSRVSPTPIHSPKLVVYSREVAEILDLAGTDCVTYDFAQVFSGNQVLAGMDPYATRYGGHQFGNWAGQLGDGRAINLGEIVNNMGQRWALQLKGAGPTPYSRNADGLAVLRSSLREFICSEAMYHLGIPTTRALSLVLTGEEVVRDMFYDGNPKPEPGAVVCRVAPSFSRFGSFEILAAHKEFELLRQFLDYTIAVDFPDLHFSDKPVEKSTYVEWFREISRRTVNLIVQWMRVGFVHGVMNTDNMSTLGLTIDYGPYGWLEDYDPNWTPNTTDAQGRRYCFGKQPQIALWNLTQLANAIYPLIQDAAPLEEALKTFATDYQTGWQTMMAQKLGLPMTESDPQLISELLDILSSVETDMTIFFRNLAKVESTTPATEKNPKDRLLLPLMDAYYNPAQLTVAYKDRLGGWLDSYVGHLRKNGIQDSDRRTLMDGVNPKYVFRNYLAQLATDGIEKNDYTMVHNLLDVLRHPYDEQPENETFAAKRPEWARNRPGCSMLSCSS